MNFTSEMIEKAKAAKSPEELAELAKASGMELTQESANAYFEQLHAKTGELSDDELENVAGGGCHKGSKLVVTHLHSCNDWVCNSCGYGLEYKTQWVYQSNGQKMAFDAWTHEVYGVRCGEDNWQCRNCRYMIYEKGLWLCNNPKKCT